MKDPYCLLAEFAGVFILVMCIGMLGDVEESANKNGILGIWVPMPTFPHPPPPHSFLGRTLNSLLSATNLGKGWFTVFSGISWMYQVMEQAEGEAKRYYEHAITLRNTLIFLRNNPSLFEESSGCGLGVDLLRLESMASLDPATLGRVLQKNYRYTHTIHETLYCYSSL